MKHNIIFTILLLMIVLPFVQSAPPVIQQQFTEGFNIKYPSDQIIREGHPYEFEAHVFNVSNGVPLYSGIDCYFHLYNSTGKHQLILTDNTTSHIFDYSFYVLGDNFSVGDYYYIIQCNSSTLGGYVEVPFEVTKYGLNTVLWLGIIIFIFLVSIMGIVYYIKKGMIFDIGSSESYCSRCFEDAAPIKGIIFSVLHSFLEHFLLWAVILGVIPVWCLSEIISISGMPDMINIMFWLLNIYFVLIFMTTLYWFDRVFKFVKDMIKQAEELNRGIY